MYEHINPNIIVIWAVFENNFFVFWIMGCALALMLAKILGIKMFKIESMRENLDDNDPWK